jgi:hypothetical protein
MFCGGITRMLQSTMHSRMQSTIKATLPGSAALLTARVEAGE